MIVFMILVNVAYIRERIEDRTSLKICCTKKRRTVEKWGYFLFS